MVFGLGFWFVVLIGWVVFSVFWSFLGLVCVSCRFWGAGRFSFLCWGGVVYVKFFCSVVLCGFLGVMLLFGWGFGGIGVWFLCGVACVVVSVWWVVRFVGFFGCGCVCFGCCFGGVFNLGVI